MASLICKTVKGRKYWYIVESRRIDGKVKQVVLEYIGNQKKLSDRLLGADPVHIPDTFTIKSYSHGCTLALVKIAEMLGIVEIMNACFSPRTRGGVTRGMSLMLAALHRATDPGSKNEFSRWFAQTSLPWQFDMSPQTMTSQHFWDQMDGITEEQLQKAEDAIIANVLELYPSDLERLALDYTNYFTYISSENENCTLAKRGKNKQKRHDLRQCSLAIVTSKELGIPLFSHVYEGNRNDQTEFREYTKLLKERLPDYQPDKTTLVFDGGSNTKKNLKDLNMHYICGFSLSSCKELYQIDREAYEEIELKNGKKVKAFRTHRKIWDQERICILTLSKALYRGQEQELKQGIKKTIDELDALNEQIKNPRSRIEKTEKALKKRAEKLLKRKYMKEIITVTIENDRVSYIVDTLKETEIMNQYFGKKLMITDQDGWTTEEIIGAYYEQDLIEKIFRDSKDTDHFSMQPIYHWTDQKIRVHIFICLLGLTLSSVLQKEMEKRGIQLSKNRLLDELEGIRESWIKASNEDTGKIIRKLEKMNDTQEKIWKVIEEL